MNNKKQEKILLIVLLCLLFVIYIAGLFVDVTRDASKYAFIPKEIVKNQQWVNLKIMGEPYNQKPHLMFWLPALSYLLFGVSNFSFKLPIFLYSLLGLFFTYKLGEKLYTKKVGRMAALMIAFSIVFILYNQDLHTDTILFTNSAFALWQLYEYLSKRKWQNLILSGVALGLCLLSKGPFGVMIPFLAVMGYLIAQKKWKEMFRIQWLYIILIAFTFAIPVFYQLYINWGIKGISFFFFGNTVGRFTGAYLGHTPDPTFYIHNSAYLLLPWSVIFFYAIGRNTQKAFNKKFGAAEHYLFWGLVTFLVLISISVSKLPNYLLSALPLMAILTSRTWFEIIPKSKAIVKIQGIVNYFLWLIVLFIIYFFSKEYLVVKVAIIVAIFVVSQLVTRYFEMENKLQYRSMIGLVILGLALNIVAIPVLFGYQAQPRAAEFLNQKKLENPEIFNYQRAELKHLKRLWEQPDSTLIEQFNQTPEERHFSYNYELLFYSDYPIQDVETDQELSNALSHSSVWFFTDDEGKEEIERRAVAIDTIISYDHFSLKRTAKLFTSSKEESPFIKRYLIETRNEK